MTASPRPVDMLPAKLPSLTGYRIVLFIAVFLTHALGAARFFQDDSFNRLGTIAPYGTAALSAFFVLSGFVLTWQEPWNTKLGLFWRRRAAKIFPGHFVAWAATLILIAIVGPLSMIARTGFGPAVANLFLVQTWFPDSKYVLSVYGINWSVSCEVAFYLLLPLLVRPLLRIRADRLWVCLVCLAVWMFVLPAVIDATIKEPAWSFWAPLSFHQAWLVYFFPLVRLPEFVIGVVLARMVQTRRWPSVPIYAAVLITLVLWGVMRLLPPIYESSNILAIGVGFFVPIIATRDIAGRSKWFNRKALVVLGNASYATYLVHFPLLAATRELVGPTRQFGIVVAAVIVVLLFAVNILVGLALYQFVERPVLRRFSTPSHRPVAEVASAVA